MTQIELIKAEIKRMKEAAGIGLSEYDMGQENGKVEVCNALLSFIESLKKEQVPTKEEQIAMLLLEYEKGRADVLAKLGDVPKIKGWVARDKSGDLYFFHYDCKPHRTDGIFHSECSEDVFHIDNSLFPELSWKTEPIEVELPIIRV